ncbi:glucose-1-phosphate adenylyltransferase [Thermodesulfovibrio aggregans]|uniref:Glucose-1-phosphate adenylyltransferase n=1 Tax=Thermodesulfovibrio aggregans TaxID=86166 RepID=A0A0U9HU21_9BACT|nr:glucose-1-phosphate adenylyltransferase [Thermodesulfovibrio aggregans]GAQ95778.1 glucose-1-phosphate adenylyltransferase [Thermodesulfovibrio aggregans]
MPKVLAIVLAGGKGERLFPLTSFRSKPSVPFGARYRIVDFVLSNLVNSQIYSIYLLVQYKSQSLIEHIRQNWFFTSVGSNHFVTVVPPQMRMGPEWFQGTADAVFQNMGLIKEHKPDIVIIFGADHIYRMDIRQMIKFHIEKNAEVTVAARPVPLREASAFGVIVADSDQRIVGFQEKPKQPQPMPDNPQMAYVSMGNYIFNTDILINALISAEKKKQNDFGAHVIPELVERGAKVYAYDFATNEIPGIKPYEERGYWRDVGTIRAYFDAHMDMLGETPVFEIYNKMWPIYPAKYEGPPVKILDGEIKNSIIADGALIYGGKIENSFIRSGCIVEKGAEIKDSLIMDDVVIKRNSKLYRVIVDKKNVVYEGEEIGFSPEKDRFRCHIDSSGICIIPRAARYNDWIKEFSNV